MKKVFGTIIVFIGFLLTVYSISYLIKGNIENTDYFSYPLFPIIIVLLGIRLFRETSFDKDSNIVYADIGKRTLALIVDFIIILPFLIINYKLFFQKSYYHFVLSLQLFVIVLQILFIWLLYKFGGSPGKLVVGIKVVKNDFTRIGIKQALLRTLVDNIFCIIFLLSTIIIFSNPAYSVVSSLPKSEKNTFLFNNSPFWYIFLQVLHDYWLWGEIIVLMLNRKRKALHDLIAGTVVIVVNKKILKTLQNK